VMVLDDGFQHRWIHRDLDIVLLDSRQPLGNGLLLPRGPLREPPAALVRAGVVVFTRSQDGAGPLMDNKMSGILSARPLLRSRIRPTKLVGADGTEIPLSFLAGKKIFAFSGIAQPDSFRQTVEGLGGVIAGFRAFRDHHRYTPEDWGRIEHDAGLARADLVLATEKDLVKLQGIPHAQSRLFSLAVEMEILEGADEPGSALQNIVFRTLNRSPGLPWVPDPS